jgi:hypothetical protein
LIVLTRKTSTTAPMMATTMLEISPPLDSESAIDSCFESGPFLCLNQVMFLRKVRVEYRQGQQLQPCPLKWLDSFSMRNFTNATVFDDTLPVADGAMEIGTHVPLDQLRDAMEDWFRRKSYLPKDGTLVLTQKF